MINLSQETEALARRMAGARHLSVDEIIRVALEDKARMEGIEFTPHRPRDQSPEAIAERRARTDAFIAAIAAAPELDPRSPHEIADELNAL